jgi:hypothetical protein
MFPHIIENKKLVRNLRNTWKHHRTRLAKTDIKLTVLLSKLHGLNKGGLDPSCTWIKCNKAPIDALKDPQVQPLLKLANQFIQCFFQCLHFGPSKWSIWNV